MMCDFGTGNNNKMNWVLEDKQELIDIVCSPQTQFSISNRGED